MTSFTTALEAYLQSLKTDTTDYLLLEEADSDLAKLFAELPSAKAATEPFRYLPERIFGRAAPDNQTLLESKAQPPIRLPSLEPARMPPPGGAAPPKVPSNSAWEDTGKLRSAESMDKLRLRMVGCRRCGLCESRQHIVFGAGHQQAKVFFIGEGPGQEEDRQGLPFVGKSGVLLTQMILSIGLNREAIYISNVVKCRPENNRNPEPNEIAACLPVLETQIDLLKPQLIVLLGNVALKALFGAQVGAISKVRGTQMTYQNTPLIPTFHPSYLLRNPAALYAAWDDMRRIRSFLNTLRRQNADPIDKS